MSRLEKLRALASVHPWYSAQCKRLSESEFDFLVEFIEDHAHLTTRSYLATVMRLGLDVPLPPSPNALVMWEILLVSANV